MKKLNTADVIAFLEEEVKRREMDINHAKECGCDHSLMTELYDRVGVSKLILQRFKQRFM